MTQAGPAGPRANFRQTFGLVLIVLGALVMLASLAQAQGALILERLGAKPDLAETTAALAAFTDPLPLGTFPDQINSAPAEVRRAYAFVAEPTNHKLVQSLSCYCGCDSGLDHQSLFSCYIEAIGPDGAEYSHHGLACLTCLNEAWDAADLKSQGKTDAMIKEQIDADYGRPKQSAPL